MFTCYVDSKRLLVIQSKLLLELRRADDSIGHDKLGFCSHEIGTYSIRIGDSVEMFLENDPVFLIMRAGR